VLHGTHLSLVGCEYARFCPIARAVLDNGQCGRISAQCDFEARTDHNSVGLRPISRNNLLSQDKYSQTIVAIVPPYPAMTTLLVDLLFTII
jgi:hypothetical protein